jgi:hypothetical protein
MSEENNTISWTCISEDMEAPPPRRRFSVKCTLDPHTQIVKLKVECLPLSPADAPGVRTTHTACVSFHQIWPDARTKQVFVEADALRFTGDDDLFITDKNTDAATREALFDAHWVHSERTHVDWTRATIYYHPAAPQDGTKEPDSGSPAAPQDATKEPRSGSPAAPPAAKRARRSAR